MRKPRLRRSEASEYLRVVHGVTRAPATLAKLGCLGGGPDYRKIGRIPLYEPAALDRWVAEQLTEPMRSTAEG